MESPANRPLEAVSAVTINSSCVDRGWGSRRSEGVEGGYNSTREKWKPLRVTLELYSHLNDNELDELL